MVQLILKRLLIMISKFMALTVITFFFGYAVLRIRMNNFYDFFFHQPPINYWDWITNGLFRGDFGYTMIRGWASSPTTVVEVISRGLGNTVSLLLLTLIIVYGIGIPLGIISSRYENKFLGRFVKGFSALGASVPAFVLSLLLLRQLAFRNQWFPWRGSLPIGMERESVTFLTYFLARIHHLIIPSASMAFVLLIVPIGYLTSGISNVKKETYVTTARAKGNDERRLLKKHILKNATTPLISSAPLQISAVISGAIIIEELFSIPGVASLFWQAFIWTEIELMKGIILLFGAILLVASFISEIIIIMKNPILIDKYIK